MIAPTTSRIVFLALVVLAVLVGGWLLLRFRRYPDQVERLGGFEIVTHTLPYLTGWNEGRLHTSTTEDYSLRYRGKPFTFEGKAGMFGQEVVRYARFNSIITFDPSVPAILLNVGDPNNSSFFYLAREQDGQPVATLVGATSGGVAVDWLDPPAEGVVRIRDVARHRGRLSGGRWLLLGETTVLDVQTLAAYPLAQPATAEDPSLNQFMPPMGMSPDRQSFVRFGYSSFPESRPLLIVFGIVDSSWYNVPIRRRVERFNLWEDIDSTWLDYYYEWHREEGRDRLRARKGVTPRPYRGRRPVEPTDPTYREYDLMGVAPEMREVLLRWLEHDAGGVRQPDSPGGSASVKIGEQTVNVTTQGEQVGMWMERGSETSLVDQLGDRFDAVLATGVHDELFLP